MEVCCPVIIAMAMVVSIYDTGSLLPLSISSKESVPYFSDKCLERKIEKTEAASVELKTEPIRKPSVHCIPSTNVQNTVTDKAVSTTPIKDSRMALAATGLAVFHFVPKPP